MDTTLQTTLVINAIAVWLLQWMKGTSFLPWVTTETEKVNRAASALFAALASVGMVLSVVHTGVGGGTGDITIHYAGLTLVNVLYLVWHTVANYATQKGLYRLFYGGITAAVGTLAPAPVVPAVPPALKP